MMVPPLKFSKNLLKGRIAETIFEQLLRDAGCFTILSFGYEKIIPELANHHDQVEAKETMEIIRRAPDFAVINNDTHEVHLIEVKYLMHPTPHQVLRAAKQMYETWKPAYLFLATPQGFFFDKGQTIVENNGEIKPLEHKDISPELQAKYLQLLNEFIKPL